MKFSLISISIFPLLFLAHDAAVTAAAHDGGKTTTMMLRKGGGDHKSCIRSFLSSSLHHDQKLTHEYDINEGTPVVDLCDYYPEYGVSDSLPIDVANGEPDKVFKIENAAGVKFTFLLCNLVTTADTSISIWDGFDQGEGNHVAFGDDGCGTEDLRSILSWSVPDNSVYYVKFGAWCDESYTGDVTWSTDVDWEHCFPPTAPKYCSPSILYPDTSSWGGNYDMLCCDDATGAVGPNCCGTVPYDASTSSCCGDGSIVSGADASCTPSSQPSATPSPSLVASSQPTFGPTRKPTPSPVLQPNQLTCDMFDPCNYDMEDDGMGGVKSTGKYYPVCIRKDTTKKSVYLQQCYHESIIGRLSAGDSDPNNSDRTIVNCGCCPSDDMLPAGIDKVKGSTGICDGGLDCLAAGANVMIRLETDIDFQTCIDGREIWRNNFYIPSRDETVSCGQCSI